MRELLGRKWPLMSARHRAIVVLATCMLGCALIAPGLLPLSLLRVAQADATAQTIPFSQNWTNTGLITANDNWSGVPGIEGFLGQDITTSTGTDPQILLTTSAVANDLDVIANQTNPNTLTSGGVAEFDGIANPTIALQGSATADAPHVVITLNTTGQTGINVSYNLRDVDGSADNAVQPVALQYRVGTSGNYTNIPAGFVADATTGPSLATLVTPVSVTLPAACDNQPVVQVRVITANAVGNDEWVGIDDINITSGAVAQPALSINDVTQTEGNSGASNFTFTVSLAPASAQAVSVAYATADGTTNPATGGASCGTAGVDYVTTSGTLNFTAGMTSLPITVSVCGDTTTEPTETFFVNLSNPTNATISDSQGVGTITNDEVTITPIYAIQGSGSTSPLANQSVTTTGIVTGIKTGSSGGFFIQDPNGDGNPNTSDGVFVFTGSSVPAAAVVGNNVQVSGTISEFIPSQDLNQKPLTELSGTVTASVLSTGNPVPAPVQITAADTLVNNLENLEKYEGMRVSVPSLTTIAPTQGTITEPSATVVSNGVFYGVVTGVARPFREPGINASDPLPAGAPATVPRFDENPERLRVDSDGQPGTTALNVTTGTVFANVVGELDYSFRTYTILPEITLVPSALANATAVPVPQPNELTVGSFNMERFFDTVDDPATADPVLTPTAFNNRLNKVSLAVRNQMRLPDVLGVEEMENLSTLQAVRDKINNDEIAAGRANPAYEAFLVEGNDVGGIDVGFLVKTARVTVVDVTQFGKTTTYINPNNGQPELLNDRPPLVLRATIARPAGGGTFAFTVIVNHLRSLSFVNDPVDGNRVRTKRRAQAEDLANLIQARQTADPTERIISVGDYNAFQVNDGYVDVIGTIKGTPAPPDQVTLASSDLVNPDLTNLVDTLPAGQRYSFTFDGNAQVLDHVIINPNALRNLNRFAYARNDADFPVKYYEDGTRAERESDHDMPVAFFSLGAPLAISEFRFRGPTVSAPGDGANDEYVELYNNQGVPLTVNTTDGSNGWALVATNSVGTAPATIATIPNGTVLPVGGHYLIVHQQPPASLNRPDFGPLGVAISQYNLNNYAVGDDFFTTDIADSAGLAVFQTSNPANFTLANRLDAVGLNNAGGAGPDLYREGTPLISPDANDGQYAFVRKLTTGTPQDTDNNANDFVFVSTNAGSYGGVQSTLGAPGPENCGCNPNRLFTNGVSPTQRNAQIKAQLIEPNLSSSVAPNRVRDQTQVPNGAQGTLDLRRRFVNNTNQTITRLRFRVVDVTTLNSSGYVPGGSQADIRLLNGSDLNNVMTSRGPLTVQGTTVEAPAPLAQALGGGLNSSATVTLPGAGLAPGATIDVHFLLGVQQVGSYRFFINVEALTIPPPPPAQAMRKRASKQ